MLGLNRMLFIPSLNSGRPAVTSRGQEGGLGWGCFRKGGTKMITIQRLITKTCIFLFFTVLASKLAQLLITANADNTNRIQRENLFNNCIHSQNKISRLSRNLEITNFLKLLALTPSPCEAGRGLGCGDALCFCLLALPFHRESRCIANANKAELLQNRHTGHLPRIHKKKL
jgi:hypothetical protein